MRLKMQWSTYVD